jgi:hypothetical protein
MSFNGFGGFEPVADLAPPHSPVHGVIRINYQVLRQRAFDAVHLSEELKHKLKEILQKIREESDQSKREALQDQAGKIRVPSDCMVVVDVLLNMELLGVETNATNLKKRVANVLVRQTTGPALDAIKLTLAWDMIAFKMRGATKIFGMTPAQKANSETVSRYMKKFAEVLQAQMANLNDPMAGSDLLPPDAADVYFNILATYKAYQSYKKKGKTV